VRAVRLLPGESGLQLVDLPVPEPRAREVLVGVTAAGVCRSDVHAVDGVFEHLIRRPVTLGHEVSGVVHAVGDRVADVAVGTSVVVMVGWGCGRCEWCRSGHEQLCPEGDEAGSTRDGGFAEFMLVPDERYVVPLEDIDPQIATPFGCAALSALAAVKRVLPHLTPHGSLAVLGSGGLGTYAVHYATRLSSARVVAVDTRASALERARAAGADATVLHGPETPASLMDATAGRGFDAVLDFVGSDESLAVAAGAVARRGVIALLGLAGGHVSMGFDTLAPEASITTVVAGTLADLHEVVHLARTSVLDVPLRMFPLEDAAAAVSELRGGRVDGRAVLVPSRAPS
jgi:alcohol dehydrogenase, propanol-preferring